MKVLLGFILLGAISVTIVVGAQDDANASKHSASARAELENAISLARELLTVAEQAKEPGDAREAVQEALQILSSAPGAEESEDVALLRWQAGFAAHGSGDLASARDAWGQTLVFFERTLPPDHPDVQSARGNLALTMRAMGDLPGARALQEQVLEILEKTLQSDHPDLQTARGNLAITMLEMGDLPGARALEEQVLEIREKTLPPDHPDLQTARGNLAITMLEMGDLPGARALFEQVMEIREKTLPPDHPELQAARLNLAGTMFKMGDLPGASALFEQVLQIREKTLPPDHLDLQGVRGNLAATMFRMGDLPGARALQEQVLETLAKILPSDHPELQVARLNLSGTMSKMGDLPGARALQEQVLEIQERTLPPDHPDLQIARGNLANTMRTMGDLPGAKVLEEQVLKIREKILPPDHPDLQLARRNLAWTMAESGDISSLAPLLETLASGHRRRLMTELALSPREMQDLASSTAHGVSTLLTLSPLTSGADRLDPLIFQLIETVRAVSTTQTGLFHHTPGDTALARLRWESLRARQRLGDLVASLAELEEEKRPDPQRIADAARDRDEADRKLMDMLRDRGHAPVTPDLEKVADMLPPSSVAVGYRAYTHWDIDPQKAGKSVRKLMAYVVLSDGTLTRVELGPLDEIRELVVRWRTEIDKKPPLLSQSDPIEEQSAGEQLRQMVLDPVLEACGKAKTLHICLDDVLHLVPLDALPMGEALLEDEYDLRFEASFSSLLSRVPAEEVAPGLLALGGIDYDAEVDESNMPDTTRSAAPPVSYDSRDGTRFLPLGKAEVDSLAKLFHQTFGHPGDVLRKKEASKAALHAMAPGKRFLHLATHGYFSTGNLVSSADSPTARVWTRQTFESSVTGLSPMSLCGIALAGANLGMDDHGRVPGIMTAEELAGMDLRGCELAVLAACETNVGLGRSGQGIASLQAALHAAGVRTAVTSLWIVPDRWTKELMLDFYRRVWQDGQPKAEALWAAKQTLRVQGARTKDWAGWVLLPVEQNRA